MRVAYVIGGLPFGGVESWLFDTCHALRAAGEIEPVVVNVSGTGVRLQDYVDSGLDVRCVGSSTHDLATHRLGTAVKLRAVLRDIAPDIVHTLHFSGDYFGRLAALGLGVPVITHIRNVKREKKWTRVAANKLLSRATDLYLCVSRGAAETVALDHNAAGRPVRVLYNAIDQAKLDVPPRDMSDMGGPGKKTLLAVGRLVAQKNFDFLLRVFAKVRQEYPAVRLVILGDGGERERLETQVRAAGLAGAAFLPGYSKDVAAYMRAAHVLVMPSLFEGFPITHVEAMACGLPAVISEHVPSREVCGDSALVLPLDEDRFADALISLLTDDARHAAMRAAALEKAGEFTLEKYLERLTAIYRDLVAAKRR
ncbi:MAG: glycosyltransferase [Desulfovibrionaceae bacterium]|jgi:glycosyltransferase involved in cell wall biosynthesis|nr:glycosyltransferase [Desulfovibrionaceae bacterium]